MNRWSQKTSQYSAGLQKINELIMLNLVVKEPEALIYNPEEDGPIKEGQLDRLDPNDPLTYMSYVHFPPPLPLDQLILLNELQQKMAMGLESKEGALRALGEEFPEEKIEEIRYELMEDAKSEGALSLVKMQIQKQIMDLTGMAPGPDGTGMPIAPTMDATGDVMGDGVMGAPTPENMGNPLSAEIQAMTEQSEAAIRETLVTEAYGTKIPPRRNITK
jgi:hypothetical protein